MRLAARLRSQKSSASRSRISVCFPKLSCTPRSSPLLCAAHSGDAVLFLLRSGSAGSLLSDLGDARCPPPCRQLLRSRGTGYWCSGGLLHTRLSQHSNTGSSARNYETLASLSQHPGRPHWTSGCSPQLSGARIRGRVACRCAYAYPQLATCILRPIRQSASHFVSSHCDSRKAFTLSGLILPPSLLRRLLLPQLLFTLDFGFLEISFPPKELTAKDLHGLP